jgi:hypothetical protein
MTIPAVGPITALTWVLEVDDVKRFHRSRKPSVIADCVVPRRVHQTSSKGHLFPSNANNFRMMS